MTDKQIDGSIHVSAYECHISQSSHEMGERLMENRKIYGKVLTNECTSINNKIGDNTNG